MAPQLEQATSASIRTNMEEAHMKIAVPVDNGRVSAHFGHSSVFELYVVDEATKAIRLKTTLAAPPHEPSLLPRWLHEHGANIIITGGMGPRAQDLCAENDIRVVIGAPAERMDDIVDSFLAGALQVGANLCDH
jgi:predicted Fe-Mo cluster-binding NifX family protein